MKRHIRHLLPVFSLVLVFFAGAFLLLPHDVCISKIVADGACVCKAMAADDGSCECCGVNSKSLGCGDHEADTAGGDGSTDSGASCFSISSSSSQMTGAERVVVHAPVLAVLAFLPQPLDINLSSVISTARVDVECGGLSAGKLHRDNCVFLI